MDINPIVFFDIVIALFVVSAALIAMTISYTRIFKKLLSHQKKYDELLDKINEKETDLLEDARRKGAEIIESASLKGQSIISSSESISENSKNLLTSSTNQLVKDQSALFEKTSQGFLEEYKKMLDAIKNTTLELSTKASKDIEMDTIKELKDYDSILAKETFEGQKIVEQKIEEEFSQTQKQVNEYKTQMLKKIENDIYEILKNVTKEALGKALPLADHEQLILEALEKAKKEWN